MATWTTDDPTQDGNFAAVLAQVFETDGTKSGIEILVNTQTADFQTSPAITALSDGGFAVSWRTSDDTQDGSVSAIKAQVFSAVGGKLGSEFLVNTNATGAQGQGDIANLSNGNFVVTWRTDNAADDGDGNAIKGQVFNTAGVKQGTEFLVNTQADMDQTNAMVTGLEGGGFVVTWETLDTSQDGSGTAVKAQVFDSTGAKQGTEFLVNSNVVSDQIAPAIHSLSTGGFVITWGTLDATQDGNQQAIKAQVFDATGAKQGSEFLVNSMNLVAGWGDIEKRMGEQPGIVATATNPVSAFRCRSSNNDVVAAL